MHPECFCHAFCIYFQVCDSYMAASIPDHSHTSGKICLCIPRVVKEGCLHHKSKETLILIFFRLGQCKPQWEGGTIARNDDTIKLKLVWGPLLAKTILRLKKLLSLIPTCFAGTKGNCSVLHRCWHALWSFATATTCQMHQLDHPTASLEVSLGLAGWTYQTMVQSLQCMPWRL